jgi:hypothetical protein
MAQLIYVAYYILSLHFPLAKPADMNSFQGVSFSGTGLRRSCFFVTQTSRLNIIEASWIMEA